MEDNLAEFNQKIKTLTAESTENNKLSELKGAMVRLKKEIVELDQKREIISW